MIPGLRARRISALRADSPQHLYQCARAADRDASASNAPLRILRRTNLGRGRLCGIHRDGLGCRTARGGAGSGRGNPAVPARDRHRIAMRVCFRRRCCAITSPPTSRSICLPALDEATRLRFRHDKKARHAEVCRRAHREAGRISIGICLNCHMSEMSGQIELFLDELRRQNASAHTVRNYASDLDQFLVYFRHPRQRKPTVEADRRAGDSRMAGTFV